MPLIVALLLAQGLLPPLALPYRPIVKAERGTPPRIEAQIKEASARFAPLIFARRAGSQRYSGYPMSQSRTGKWLGRLPASITSGKSFEYFIEVRTDAGVKDFGTADQPFAVQVEEPEIKPAKLSVSSDAAGVAVLLDGKEVGKAPLEFEAPAGRHLVSIAADDGRGAEQSTDAIPGKTRKLFIALPAAGGPGTLSLQSEPAGARLTLDGKVIGQTPFVGETIPGDHQLVVERQGFVRQERQVSWREGHDVDLAFSLVALPKDPALTLESNPAGATVIIDGLVKGVTPYAGALAAGRHQAVLRLAGRREVASDFDMPDGRDLALRLELPVATKSTPHLTVTSKPAGAAVSVDGATPVLTPWSGEVTAGKHKLEVSLPGYVSDTRAVDARPNRDQEVNFALEREKGPAQVTVVTEPPGAEVSVDGNVAGSTPLDKPIELEPGDHQIMASRAGYKGVAQSVTVEQGQELSLRLTMAKADAQPAPPTIGIATIPEGAKFYVDGKLAGTTPIKVKTSPGPHEIRVTLDGYVTRSSKLNVPEGRDFELRVAVSMRRIRGSDEVSAPDARALARAELKRAQSCYTQGDWDCAIKGFQAAYDYKPIPELIFNIAQAQRRKNDLKAAAEGYRAYLKAEPEGRLAKQATELAERCEKAAAGGDANVAEDDKAPPTILHDAVARAVRNEDLKVSARISDDKSGVFNPQLCFRNLFSADYECASLTSTGGDAYEGTIAAKNVVEGLAYYIEAFDNAGNGPAQSGDPKAPHAVSVEDKAAAPPPAPASKKAAPVVAQQIPIAPLVEPPPPPRPWSLVIDAGAEHAFERYSDGVVDGRAGLTLSRRIDELFFARLRLDARLSSQPYRTFTPTPGGPTPTASFSEQRYSAAAEVGLDLARLVLHTGRFELVPLATISYQRWQNIAFPADFGGAGGELRARVPLFHGLALAGGAGYAWNVLQNTRFMSAVGAPRSDTFYDAGLSLAVAGDHSIDLTYRGDVLAVANDYRVSNGLTVGFGSTF